MVYFARYRLDPLVNCRESTKFRNPIGALSLGQPDSSMSTEEEVKVEVKDAAKPDSDDDSDDSDKGPPELEPFTGVAGSGESGAKKSSKSERKGRKTMTKLGMKPVSGIK